MNFVFNDIISFILAYMTSCVASNSSTPTEFANRSTIFLFPHLFTFLIFLLALILLAIFLVLFFFSQLKVCTHWSATKIGIFLSFCFFIYFTDNSTNREIESNLEDREMKKEKIIIFRRTNGFV